MDPEKAGYNSRQVFSPLPAVWTQELFGLNFIPFTDVKLTAKPEEEPFKCKQWRVRTCMTRSSDPLSHWQAHHRQAVLPADGIHLREQPTMICYFASPFTDLATCGVYKDGSDHHLTSAYLRTTISQFLYEMQSQVQELARIAGCICFGTRIIRTSQNTGFAF